MQGNEWGFTMAEVRKGCIYLVRHGEGSYTAGDYDQISSLGVKQARALGRWIANRGQHFRYVVTGNLRRQKQTAKECMAVLPELLKKGSDWLIDDGFNEFDALGVLARYRPDMGRPGAMGAYLSKYENPALEFKKLYAGAVRRWVDNQDDNGYRESWPDYKKRTIGAIKRIIENVSNDQNVIVFTSGGTISTICQELRPIPDSDMIDLMSSLVNCGVTKLLLTQDAINIGYINCIAHLDGIGEN